MEHIEEATIDDVSQLADLLSILFSLEADFRPDRGSTDARLAADYRGTPEWRRIFVPESVGETLGYGEPTRSPRRSGAIPRVLDWQDYAFAPVTARMALGHACSMPPPICQNESSGRITLLTDRTNDESHSILPTSRLEPSANDALATAFVKWSTIVSLQPFSSNHFPTPFSSAAIASARVRHPSCS